MLATPHLLSIIGNAHVIEGILLRSQINTESETFELLINNHSTQKRKQTQTFIDSMTNMFPITVTRLREPATSMRRTISTVVYGLPEKTLLVLAELDELWLSILSASDIRLTGASGANYLRPWQTERLWNHQPLCNYFAISDAGCVLFVCRFICQQQPHMQNVWLSVCKYVAGVWMFFSLQLGPEVKDGQVNKQRLWLKINSRVPLTHIRNNTLELNDWNPIYYYYLIFIQFLFFNLSLSSPISDL